MAQLADLPSRLSHILFGQSPERWRIRGKRGKKEIGTLSYSSESVITA